MDLHLNLFTGFNYKICILRRYNCLQINILQLNILGTKPITYAGDRDCDQAVLVKLLQSFLYTSLKYLTMTLHPQKFPGFFSQDCQFITGHRQIPRLVPETPTRSQRQTCGIS